MIRSLRILDPSDVFLNFVTQPVRTYLLKRKDPIRCIISSLTGSTDSELHGELKKGGSLEYGADADDEDGKNLSSSSSSYILFYASLVNGCVIVCRRTW